MRNYHVDVEMNTNIVNAFMAFKESVTNNEVTYVKYPMGWFIKYLRIDGIDYELISMDEIRNAETDKIVKSKTKIAEIKQIANDIIEKGSEYLNSLFNTDFNIKMH